MNTLFIGYNDGLARVKLNDVAEAQFVLHGPPVASVAVDPHERDLVYAATLGAGLWRSHDGGATFQKSDFEWPLTWCATVSPCERTGATGALYLGTQLSAVFKSTDAGKSFEELTTVQHIPSRSDWSFPPAPNTHHVHQIALHLEDPDVILFGVELGGVYHSSDGGRTWAQTSADPDPHTLRIHPTQPNRVYEGGGASYCDSRDGGASWRRNLEGIPDEIRYFYSLAVDSGDPANVLLSGSRDPFSGHAVIAEMPVWSSLYRHKLDLGFEEITDGLPPRDETAMGTLAAGDAGEFVYVTEPGDIYRSTDGGRSFATVPYAARAARGSIARAVSFSPR